MSNQVFEQMVANLISPPDVSSREQYYVQCNKWSDILWLARSEPTLADAINQAEMVYEIIRKQTHPY